MFTIDLSLKNNQLYAGCEIVEVGGRLTLATDSQEASNIVGRNVATMLEKNEDHTEITLTGPMAVWSYLVVFHQVVHRFKKVWYDDGRSGAILIAQH